jgi:hypothetical protein
MGAETRIMVRVLVTKAEWREVYAVTRDEAMAIAARLPNVNYALAAYYPEELPAETVSPVEGER